MIKPIDPKTPMVNIEGLRTFLGDRYVLDGIDLSIYPREIVAIVGGSGAGKSTLLRSIVLLQPFSSGRIELLGKEVTLLTARELTWLQQHWGMMFQHGALFGSMTVLENVAFPLKKHTTLDHDMILDLARLKIVMTGLSIDAADKYPSELSGGMQKRAALARALALDPPLLFLDEPTAGLDPQGANGLDELILELRASLKLTVVIVTHDLDTLWRVADRVAFLADGTLVAVDTMTNLVQCNDERVRDYFKGPRARLAQVEYQKS